MRFGGKIKKILLTELFLCCLHSSYTILSILTPLTVYSTLAQVLGIVVFSVFCSAVNSFLLGFFVDCMVITLSGLYAQITNILLKCTFVGKRIHGVGNLFVMHLSFNSKAYKENKSYYISNYLYLVLDKELLFLATVISSLRLRIRMVGYFKLGIILPVFMNDSFATASPRGV